MNTRKLSAWIFLIVGLLHFYRAAIRGNLEAVLADLRKGKPASSKGIYMRKVTLSTTMGPGITVDQTSLAAKPA